MKKRILLIQLYSSLQPDNAEPMSIEVLAATLHKSFSDCVVDLSCLSEYPLPLPYVHEQKLFADYDLVGISIPQGTLPLATKLLDALENISPRSSRPLVVLGHSLPTNIPEVFLANYPWVIVVHGWGEDALVELVRQVGQRIDLDKVPGIYYRDAEAIVSTPVSWSNTFIEPPIRLDPERYFARIETSRGCVHNRCTFCLRPAKRELLGSRGSWHRLPMQQILASIENLKKTGVKNFTFADEDFFGPDLAATRELALRILDIGELNFSLSVLADDLYSVNASEEENALRTEILAILKDAGLSLLYCGVESLSNSQLRRYGKRANVEEILIAIELAKNVNISLELGYILFDPFLSMQELEENTQILEDTGLWAEIKTVFSFLNVYRHTPFEAWLVRKKLVKSFDNNLLTYTWEFSSEEVGQIATRCRAWRSRYHSVYTSLRNVARTDLTLAYSRQYLNVFRRQDLDLLRQLMGSPRDPSTLDSIVYNAATERGNLLGILRDHVSKIDNKTISDLLLLEELSRFSDVDR